MPKVTSEDMRTYMDKFHLPPRHQRGCPKNFARTLLLPLMAKGYSMGDIKWEIALEYNSLPCECKK